MSKAKLSPKERAAQFIGAVRRACRDSGKRAALRRGLSPATAIYAWPVVASLGADIGQPGESVCMDIAALFASHPQESEARNLGETCRRIAQANGNEIPEGCERRFRRLLACDDLANLTGQLHVWIRLAASRGVGVNYESLFADVWNWPWYANDIRVKWARSFWQSGDLPTEVPEAKPVPADS